MVIAVVFYVSVYIAGSRYSEADLLDSQQISRDSNIIPSLRPTPIPSSSSSSESTQRPSKGKKPKHKPRTTLLINEDSDDDEPIIRPTAENVNLMD